MKKKLFAPFLLLVKSVQSGDPNFKVVKWTGNVQLLRTLIGWKNGEESADWLLECVHSKLLPPPLPPTFFLSMSANGLYISCFVVNRVGSVVNICRLIVNLVNFLLFRSNERWNISFFLSRIKIKNCYVLQYFFSIGVWIGYVYTGRWNVASDFFCLQLLKTEVFSGIQMKYCSRKVFSYWFNSFCLAKIMGHLDAYNGGHFVSIMGIVRHTFCNGGFCTVRVDYYSLGKVFLCQFVNFI